MSDVPDPPPTVPGAPQHRAPGGTYRPISGLAVTALILSLVGILVAVTIWWVLALVPFLLGVLTMVKVDPSKRRGRVLGLWAICIALVVGVLGFTQQQAARTQAESMAGSVLAALASEATDSEKDAVLLPWIWKDVRETGTMEGLRTRYARITERYGAYRPSPDAGGPLSSTLALMMPPDPTKYEEVGLDPGAEAQPLQPGSIWYVDVTFERGTLRVGLELFGGELSMKVVGEASEAEGASTHTQAWLSDLRYFAPKTAPKTAP